MQQFKIGSPGCDELPPSIFNITADQYIGLLTYFINTSITTRDFPDELKTAEIIPIYKSGIKSMISNYRPISVLPFFPLNSLKKCIYNHLLKFIDAHD